MENDIDKKSYISDNQTRPIEFEDGILAWVDKETGLMWEVKKKENIEHGYVWSDAFSYVKKLNNENYAGFNDWRLPTKEELESLEGKSTYLEIEEKPLSKNTKGWYYWSSNSDVSNNNKAWTVRVYYGGSEYFDKNDDMYVLCVRNLSDEQK